MSCSEDNLIVMAVACAYAIKKTKKKFESVVSHGLKTELRLQPDDWRNYLRMDEETYIELLNLVTPFIKRKDTIMRTAITPHERLTATLRFLATGRNYEDLKFSTIISPQALSQIIPETCEAIYQSLHKEYMKIWFAKGKGVLGIIR
ncbi:hypothetical protein NQ318_018582 [Aromia moschata]|uniref:Uncharacterized protein n=1 Tax=Aromia moschata TaxID=1265417 RepID=A0AAV8ZHQ7_9CUCU|nr:hypothetical protein NQ318_018582 [Aromia moschata]